MDQEEQKQNDIFKDSVAKAVEKQQEKTQDHHKRIGIVEQEIQKLSGLPKDIAEIKDSLNLIKRNSVTALLPNEKSEKLAENLSVAIPLIGKLIENKIRHHHYIPKLMWITAGLFVILCLACSGWYVTTSKVDQYKAGDIKYRELKLLADTTFLRSLWKLDSVYSANPDSIRNKVEVQENLRQQRLELEEQLHAVNGQINPPPARLHISGFRRAAQ
jgi:hypothetical protein